MLLIKDNVYNSTNWWPTHVPQGVVKRSELPLKDERGANIYVNVEKHTTQMSSYLRTHFQLIGVILQLGW